MGKEKGKRIVEGKGKGKVESSDEDELMAEEKKKKEEEEKDVAAMLVRMNSADEVRTTLPKWGKRKIRTFDWGTVSKKACWRCRARGHGPPRSPRMRIRIYLSLIKQMKQMRQLLQLEIKMFDEIGKRSAKRRMARMIRWFKIYQSLMKQTKEMLVEISNEIGESSANEIGESSAKRFKKDD